MHLGAASTRDWHSNWSDVQRRMLGAAAALYAIAGWLAGFFALSAGHLDPLPVVVALLASTACLPLTLPPRSRAAVAAVGQPLLLGGAIVFAALREGDARYLSVLVLPAAAAAMTLPGWAAGLLSLTLALAAVARPTFGLASAGPALWAAALTSLLITLMAWQWRSSLQRAWVDSEHAGALARELGVRQEEVNRLNHGLQLANDLLKQSNYRLEVARREAEDARRLRSEFAASVSHELRTPLSLILGFTEVMSRSPEVYEGVSWTPMLRRDIGEIRRAARYLMELIDDTMDLARIDAVRMPVHREMADLAQVIAEAVDIAGRLLTGKPVGLSVAAEGDIPLLMLDRTRIRQVLLNLLTNAIRFTERGSIAVTARLEGEQVIVSVADTGLGIAEKDLRRIFDEFEQVDVNRPPETSGKGLGLAIAKHLIHLHDGGIWAESEPGKGSVFRFSLPVMPKQVGYLRRASSQPALAAQQPRILVADEEGEAAAFLARHLDGFTVTVASPIEAAAVPPTGSRPDLAVVVTPPNGSPQAAIGALRLPGSVPVVSCRFPTRRRLAGDPRFCAHLLKPASAEELMGTVMRLAPSGTVLAADDEPGFLQLLRRTFHAAGQEHRLLTVSSGPEALEATRRVRPALVLLDIVLPGMSGPDVASAIKADPDLSSIPLIALSGADVGGDPTALSIREFALQVGACLTGEQFLRLVRYTVAALNPLSPIGEDIATATSPVAAPRPAS